MKRRFILVVLALCFVLSATTVNAQAAWAPNVSYSVGTLVTYSGSVYKCIQAHTSQIGWEPPSTPSLWQLQSGTVPTNTNTPAATTPPTSAPTKTNTPVATTAPTNTASSTDGSPYGGTTAAIPGTVQVENFNTGGQGIAYNDAEATNQGGQYRTSEGVDIEATTDMGAGYNVGWVAAGEWTKYTVNVQTSGTYTIDFRVASTNTTGVFHLEVDGTNVTGSLAAPNTGGWQTWITVTKTGVSLSAGQHVLRLVTDAVGMNYNWIKFTGGGTTVTNTPTNIPTTGPTKTNTPVPTKTNTPSASDGSPYGGTAAALPGTVQVENFNTGGQGVAYNDAEATNQGGQYRTSEGVDIEATTDTGAGYNVGYTAAGEWLKYTVNVTVSGTYSLNFRVASAQAGGTFHLEVDGANVTGTQTVPNTGGWQTWTTVTKTGVSLTAGQRILRLVMDAAGGNFNWFSVTSGTTTPTDTPTPTTTIKNLIPMPVSVSSTGGSFTLGSGAGIYVEPNTTEMMNIGNYLAGKLRPSTGYSIPVTATTGAPANGNIYITTVGGDTTLGAEGYNLTITSSLVTLKAPTTTGLFRGLQTIRQLLPASIESSTLKSGPWTMATGTVRDYPRFSYRGAMLDVARHFFSVTDVKSFIDQLAYYKINYFHLHLSDDQGWRIVIDSWPNLATYGGSTQVGGGAGGYYTKAQYTDIVNYATARYITIVPEIDMPGHTNAALASYASLNCNNTAPALYTGTNVGFSSLCVSKETTYTFITDVVREISALTPGPYFHLGGDESSATTATDYVNFVNRVQGIITGQGKRVMGWEDIARATLVSNTVAQHWNSASLAQNAASQGAKVVMSPASKAYLDMKYDTSTPLGQTWAGYITVQTGYSWDIVAQAGLSESSVLGVEAPLWTETIVTSDNIEYMAFPRLPGYAEIGWSPATGRNWTEYKVRLGSHGSRMTNMGINFFHSTEVTWQ